MRERAIEAPKLRVATTAIVRPPRIRLNDLSIEEVGAVGGRDGEEEERR